MSRRLEGRVVLITGGTAGIGHATAKLAVAEGARVIITGRDRDGTGSSVAADLGAMAFLQADHAKKEDCERVASSAIELAGRVDALFNNAGVVLRGNAEATTEEEWEETMALNVTAPWRMCRLLIPHMRANGGGVIVNNSSDWGLVGAEDAVAYATSKGALLQMTRCLALDHSKDGIRANAVCPGDCFVARWTTEGYFRNGSGAVTAAEATAARPDLPLGRVARADEVAKAVVFLLSDDSSYMTGSHLVVDGGNTSR